MYSIQKNLSSISGGVIMLCVLMLVIALGGFTQVRQVIAKSAILFAFFATFFHGKIAMALEKSKENVVSVNKIKRVSNDDPWKIVDNSGDEWKMNNSDLLIEPSTTSTTTFQGSTLETSTTSTSPSTSTTLPTNGEDGFEQKNSNDSTITSSTVPLTSVPSSKTSNTIPDLNTEPQQSPNVDQSSLETSHIVIKGENLYSIAKQYSQDSASVNKLWVKIITLNKMNLASKNPNLIYAGETIIIPQI